VGYLSIQKADEAFLEENSFWELLQRVAFRIAIFSTIHYEWNILNGRLPVLDDGKEVMVLFYAHISI